MDGDRKGIRRGIRETPVASYYKPSPSSLGNKPLAYLELNLAKAISTHGLDGNTCVYNIIQLFKPAITMYTGKRRSSTYAVKSPVFDTSLFGERILL